MSDFINTGYTFGQWLTGATVVLGLVIAYTSFLFLNEKWWKKLSMNKQEKINTVVIISVLTPVFLLVLLCLIIYIPFFIYAFMEAIFKW
jgi:hypothetical protein